MLEVCVDSVESALEAQKGGADRFELCSNLVIGGTTPSPCLWKEVKKISNIPIHVLIRPRFGDFCYTAYEASIIKEEIKMFQELGADGIVIGSLNPDGTLNTCQMETFIEQAGTMSVTLHRAFDVCSNPMKILSLTKSLGIHTILTSGQEKDCASGKEFLRNLVEKSEKQVDILIGGGVSAEVIEDLQPFTKASSFHMSGKETLISPMQYRNEHVSMGLPSLSEYEIWRTSADKIAAAKSILLRCLKETEQ